MSSGNPVFVLPSALGKSAKDVAKNLFGSFTLGAGQFCTKPGIVFVPEDSGAQSFFDELKSLVEQSPSFNLLTEGIAKTYGRATAQRSAHIPLAASSSMPMPHAVSAANVQLFAVCLDQLVEQPE